MSDSPTQEVNTAVKWGTSHFVLLCFCFAALAAAFWLWDTHRVDQAQAAQNIAELKAQQALASNQQVQTETAQQIAQLNRQNLALQAQVQSLAASIAQRNTALITETRADVALPPDQFAQALSEKIAVPGSVLPATSGGYSVTPAGASAIMSAVDELPVDRANVADLAKSVTALQAEVANGAQELSAEKKAHQSDVAADQLQLAALKAQIKTMKRRSKLHAVESFLIGFLTGFAGKAL